VEELDGGAVWEKGATSAPVWEYGRHRRGAPLGPPPGALRGGGAQREIAGTRGRRGRRGRRQAQVAGARKEDWRQRDGSRGGDGGCAYRIGSEEVRIFLGS
jgi:hypothetical protein